MGAHFRLKCAPRKEIDRYESLTHSRTITFNGPVYVIRSTVVVFK